MPTLDKFIGKFPIHLPKQTTPMIYMPTGYNNDHEGVDAILTLRITGQKKKKMKSTPVSDYI